MKKVLAKEPMLKRRNSASHQAVLKAASDLLVEKEYCSVTIDQIAARAGVGKQTIYRWWSAKIAIYIELYNNIATENFIPIDGGSLKKDVALYSSGIYKQLTHPVASLAFKGMVAEAQNSPESHQLFRKYMLERFSLTKKIIERAVSRGEVSRSTDVDSISSLIGGALVWRLLLNDKPLDQKFISHISNSALSGLMRQGKSSS